MLFQNMPIFWCENDSCMTYKSCCWQKNISDYLGFYQGLSDYYTTFMNHIAAFYEKNYLTSIFKRL